MSEATGGGVTSSSHVPKSITTARLDALRLVARGDLEYSVNSGIWEPQVGYRTPAFDWLESNGLIEPEYEALPKGRVMQLVPVHVTDAGRAVLSRACSTTNATGGDDV